MRKKSVLVLFVLLILVGLSGCFIQSEGQGFSILSIDDPIVVSGNENLKNLNWRVVASLGGSERVVGEISPSTFKSYSGSASKYGLTIDASAIEESATYSIERKFDSALYNYAVVFTKSRFTPDPCPSGYNFAQYLIDNTFPADNTRVCVARNQVGVYGIPKNPSIGFGADISLDIDNPSVPKLSKRISQSDSSVTFDYSGERVAQVRWEGSLVTGDPLPTISDKVGVLKINQQWYFISDTDWGSYLSVVADASNEFSRAYDNGGSSSSSSSDEVEFFEERVQFYNSQLKNFVNRRQQLGSEFSWENGGSQDNAKLRVVLDRRIQKPLVTIDVRADWLGIEKLSGVPKIVDVDCVDIESGRQGYIELDIKNVGSGDGTFVVSKSGCGTLNQVYSSESERVSLGGGEVYNNFRLELRSGAVNVERVENCNVRVYDLSDPSSDDSVGVDCKIVKAKGVCQAGSERVDTVANCVYGCNSDGSAEETTLCCGSGEVVAWNGAKYVCNGVIEPDPSGCKFYDVLCLFGVDLGDLQGAISIVIIIIVLLLVIITIFLIRRGIKK